MLKVIKNNFRMIRLVFRYSKFYFLLHTLYALFRAAYTFLNVYLIKWFFEILESGRPFKELIAFLGIFVIASVAVYSLITFLDRFITLKLNVKISEKINLALIEKIKSIDYECFENSEFYDKYTRALAETGSRALEVTNTFFELFGTIASIAVAVELISTIEPLFILLALFNVGVTFACHAFYNKTNYKEDLEGTPFKRRRQYVNRTIYQPEYAKEIKLFPMHKEILKRVYSEGVEGHNNLIKKYEPRKIAVYTFQMFLDDALRTIIPWWYIAVNVINKTLTISNASVVINVISRINANFRDMAYILMEYHSHSLFIENLNVIMDYQSKIESENGILLSGDVAHSIEFKNVTFAYPGGPEILKDLSFKIEKGEKVALVGYNGAGKSTIIKLLIRLYDVQSGEILIDGINIKEYNPVSLRDAFGLIFQDFNVYAMSLLENVLLTPDYSEEERKKAYDALKGSGLLSKLSDGGLDTPVTKEFSDSGIYLSGGENQKLSLARVFAKNCGIVILDEPSSALDPISEHEMNRNMLRAAENKTVLFISHRLSSVVDSDKILYLENGVIKEEGSHGVLLEMGGKYAEMFNLQAESYRQNQILEKEELLK